MMAAEHRYHYHPQYRCYGMRNFPKFQQQQKKMNKLSNKMAQEVKNLTHENKIETTKIQYVQKKEQEEQQFVERQCYMH